MNKIFTYFKINGLYHVLITGKKGKVYHHYKVKYMSDVRALKQVLLQVILLIMMVSCGHAGNGPSDPAPTMTPSVQEMASEGDTQVFIEEFFKDAQDRGLTLDKSLIIDVKIEAVINGDGTITGFCSGNSKAQKLQFKAGQSKEDRKVTVYHELGHCMLGEKHSDNDEDIMYAQESNRPLTHWKESVDRLFDNADPSYVVWTSKQQ